MRAIFRGRPRGEEVDVGTYTVRPSKPDDIREQVLKLAREIFWGYTRILGEIRKLGMQSISRLTVRVILMENKIDTGPQRKKETWDEFLKIYADRPRTF